MKTIMNQKERNSTIYLSCIIMISIFSRYLIPKYFSPASEAENLIATAVIQKPVEKDVIITLQNFDPNNVTKEKLISFGINRKTAQSWENYISKKGRFYKSLDVLKIHGMTYEDYDFIKEHIHIPKKKWDKKSKMKREIIRTNKSASITTALKVTESFDPNIVSKEFLIEVGINKRAVKSWRNYISKGGHFYLTSDVKKVYHLTDEEFNIIEPFIKISKADGLNAYPTIKEGKTIKKVNNNKTDRLNDKAKKVDKKRNFKEIPKEEEFVTIEMNTASVKEWQAIPGIGPVLSKRIVKFRDRLGGFHSVEQLGQVYGLEETFSDFLPSLRLERGTHKQLNIFSSTEKKLSKHILISYKVAKALKQVVKGKDQVSKEDIMNIKGVDKQTIRKVLPYLDLSN